MCGTMWREEPNEMRQLLKSVFRFVQMCHYLYVLVYEESLCAKIHIAYLARIVIIIYIRVWMIKNKLKIKDSKTEFIVFRSPQAKQDLSGLSVSVDGSVIAQSSTVRDLGVIFDQFLNFDEYISVVCRSTHFHLRNIGRIRHLLQLIHALILIRLDYCNSLLYNLSNGSIERLQKIQNQAARMLTTTP